MTSTAPIGVFDSGLGGISVVRQIVQDMPHERVLYFGDSANAPYGTKTPQEVRRLSFDIMERFMSQGVKAVVIACNTATSAAVNALRDHYDIPIIGMEPALKVACDRGDTAAGDGTAPARHMPQHVIVAATPLTLREHKFAALMDRFKANNMISPQPCPDLVEIVESGRLYDGQMIWYASSYLVDDTYNSYSSGANLDLVMNSISSLVGQRDAVSIRSKSLQYNYLTISDSTSSILKLVMIGVFPIVYLAVGIAIVVKRRRANEAN